MMDLKRAPAEPAGAVGSLGLVVGLVVTVLASRLGVDPIVLATVVATVGPPATAAVIRGRVFSPATVAQIQATAGRERVQAAVDEATRRDPGWLRRWWPLWLAVVGIGFVGPEAVALISEGEGGTLSEMTREWLGLDPDGSGMTVGWVALTLVLVGFAVWFPIHLRKGWPWERRE